MKLSVGAEREERSQEWRFVTRCGARSVNVSEMYPARVIVLWRSVQGRERIILFALEERKICRFSGKWALTFICCSIRAVADCARSRAY